MSGDSNAAITGGLLGVRDCLDAIPRRWVQVLKCRDEFLAATHGARRHSLTRDGAGRMIELAIGDAYGAGFLPTTIRD